MADDLVDDLEGKPKGDAGSGAPADGKKPADKDNKKIDKKTGILVALTAAGVLLAWLTFKKPSSSTASTADTLGSSANDGSLVPDSSTGQVAGDDGTGDANDGFLQLLTTLQNQVGTLQTDVTGINAKIPASPSSGTSAAKFSLANAAKDSYVKNLATGKIYQVDPTTGKGVWIQPSQWASIKAKLGKTPKVTDYGKAPAKPKAKAPAAPTRKVPTPLPPNKGK